MAAGGYSVPAQTGTHWASGYLSFAGERDFVDRNITSPDLPITRAATAKLMVNALGLGLSDKASPFADTNDPYVTALYAAGIAAGSYEQGRLVFRPDAPITRAEVCSLLFRNYTKDKLHYGSYYLDYHENLPVNTYRADAFTMCDGLMRYSDGEATIGIDVSYYQGDIDWQQVKNAGIDFAILRLGYRGYSAGTLVEDERFREYIAGASAVGIDVGIYFFSQAINEQEAKEEANFVLSRLGDYTVKYPVVFDWEIIGNKPARTDGLSTKTLTACAKTFCDTIADAGYIPGIYFTKYLGYVSYDLSQLSEYEFWFAEYSKAPSFYYDFDMWQYSDTASIPGIKGRVDMDICFKQY
jgi:GH25 family lysozyme M1 (1,4-beta-N-acetylmuramidase)